MSDIKDDNECINPLSRIGGFKLGLCGQEFSATNDDVAFIPLYDEGQRIIISIIQIFNRHTKDDKGDESKAFKKWTKQGFEIHVETQVIVRIKKTGVTTNPDIRIKTPLLLEVKDSKGEYVGEPVRALIQCELETSQTFCIGFNNELRRQTGRTTRFIITLVDGDVLVSPSYVVSEFIATMLEGSGKKVEVVTMDLPEVIERIKEGKADNYRFPHEFFEYHKISPSDLEF